MANEELLDALDERERRLAVAAIEFIKAGQEVQKHAVVKMIGSSTSTSTPPQHQKKFDAAEIKFCAVVARELGFDVNEGSSVYSQLLKLEPIAPDALKRFSALRIAALRNAHTVLDY